MRKLISISLLTALTSLSIPAQAFLAIGESADVTPAGTLKLGLEPQIRLSEGSGANMSVFIDGGINEEMSYRALLGAGETDLVLAGSFKWVPFPDFERQPAIGFRGDINVGREMEETFTVVRIAPIISKRMQTDYILFTPYAALPVGMMGVKGKNDSIAQLAIGTDIFSQDTPNLTYNAELGTNINRAFSYLSFNITYLMNENHGFKMKRRNRD